MNISDLSYLETVSELTSITGGDCSISVINGRVKSSGCKSVKKIIKKSKDGRVNYVSVTAVDGSKTPVDSRATIQALDKVFDELDDLFDSWF